MRILIQRVSQAEVSIENKIKSSISQGLLLLIGIEDSDTLDDVEWLVKKVSSIRLFDDENGVMNLSVTDIQGEVMVVSQFTLHASTKKGNRPSYIRASKPDKAIPLYESFIQTIEKKIGKKVATGEFGAMMKINLINNGPVTIFIDSKNKE